MEDDGHLPLLTHLYACPLVRRGPNGAPVQVDLLDVKTETRLLKQCLEQAKRVIRWKTESANSHSFRTILSQGCRALHFTGHGFPGHVTFETSKGEMHMLGSDQLKKLFGAGGNGGAPKTKFVFVSACHSEAVGKAFAEAGVPHVVAVSKKYEVLDQASQEFSRAFYTALLNGRSVQEAFDIAQAHVSCCGDIPDVYHSEAAKFLLLGMGDHSEVIFSDAKQGEYIDDTRPLPQNGCDSIADFFVGRAVEVQAVFAAFMEGARLVSLVGKPKIGKTQVALRACEYAVRRYAFRRVFFFSINATHSVCYFLLCLQAH
jgi:hypothetical protein